MFQYLPNLETPAVYVDANRFFPSNLKSLLLNSWSAEYALRITPVINDANYIQSSLHWTFPQSYYSALFSARAFLFTYGYNLSNENKIARQIGVFVGSGVYPPAFSFYANGKHKSIRFCRVKSPELKEVLNDTRLHDYKINHSLTYSNESIPATTFFNFLARISVSSQCRELEVLDLDLDEIRAFHGHLVNIVNQLNTLHEYYIARVIGWGSYRTLIKNAPSYLQGDILEERLSRVSDAYPITA